MKQEILPPAARPMPLQRRSSLLFFASVLLVTLRGQSLADGPPRLVSDFTAKHCLDCHSGTEAEAGFDLESLPYQLDSKAVHESWAKALRRIEDGEMPPADYDQPNDDQIHDFVATLDTDLTTADRQRLAKVGRARPRRLNRSEYETALEDLFDMPFHIAENLPEDAKSHGFDTVGSALNVSSVQIQSYLDVLDTVFDRATTLYERPPRRKHRLTYREETGIMQVYRKGGPFHIQEDGVAFFATEKFSHLNATLSQWTAPHTAKYKVKVSTYALRSDEPVVVSLRAGGNGHAESNHVPHIFLDHFSVVEGEPQVFEWEGWLERGHFFHVYPTSLRPMRFAGKNEERRQHEYDGPAAVVQWVEVDGPIFDTWPPESHKTLWGDLPSEPIPGAKPNEDPIAHLDKPPSKIAQPRMTRLAKADKETGNRMVYDPKQGVGGEPIHRQVPRPKPLVSTRRLVSSDPSKDCNRLLRQFANHAFRRPVSIKEIAPYAALAKDWMEQGSDFETSMRVAYKALLTSPAFLYHHGTLPDDDHMLDDFALAERLSFFLWNGLPDDQLLAAAKTGDLSDPSVRADQVDRLLNDDRSARFLEQFLGSWLDLDKIDFTTPDEKLYPEHDKLLQWSMVEETHGFVRELIDQNLPAANIVDSDFAMLNWRLARHYGLPSVFGMDVRPVPLPETSPRGGLMTQASVLKVTANGTTTSPVVRGVWLMERILGEQPAPPPPGVPAIEPDIRGATTVREQLEKHRSVESCAVCHKDIDPPGVALESFDVIGGWRENYRALNEKLADIKPRYSPFKLVPTRYVTGPPVDASYQLADGRPFDDIEGFKKLLLEDERKIARGLVEKLLIYATGAEISYSESDAIEAILDASAESEFGVRTLIQNVVASPLFVQK